MEQQESKTVTQPDFHGAALLDDAGREIPITEDMIQQALAALAGARLNTPSTQAR